MLNESDVLSDLPLWSDETAYLKLIEVCEKYKVPVDVLTEMVALQRERQNQERAAGIYLRFKEILGRMD